MFDIGFPELLLVSVIALVVIGPEKLPETIRTLSLWLGRLKRSLATIKSEIEAEIGADDIRRQLRDESVLQGIEDTKVQLEEIIDTTKNDLNAINQSVRGLTDLNDGDRNTSESQGTEPKPLDGIPGSQDGSSVTQDGNPDPENSDPSHNEMSDGDRTG